MTRLRDFELRHAIPREEFDYLLLQSVLSDYSNPRRKINELLKSEVVVRVKKGLYVFGGPYRRNPVCLEHLANVIYGPSCISLEYALSYYGLIPERVEAITSVTPLKTKNFSTPVGRFYYTHLGMDKYPHGIQQVWFGPNHSVLMASPEKALCDYVSLNNVRYITDTKTARTFLEDDVRIDSHDWKTFDIEKLSQLNTFYRNDSIKHIVEAL